MLGKVMKYEFKKTWLPFVIIFAAAIIIPSLVFILTQNTSDNIRQTLRILTAAFGVTSILISSLVILTKGFENDFIGKNAYMIHMLPVKVNMILFTKALFFLIWSALSLLFMLLCVCFAEMDFSIIERLIDSIIRNLSYERNAAQYASLITLIIRTVVCFITIFGLMTATSAFGHLFGTKRIWGEFIFVVAVIIVFFVYAYFMQNMYISFETAAFYIDTAVEFAVTAGFLYFTNHIFTKKLNVL